ncbi:MAG: DUF302 domain-containing protein [Bacteroidales bacterium]
MKYYISKTIKADFDQAEQLARESLKNEGFGIIMEINVSQILKDKIDVDFRKYKILGACNPGFAHKALLAEDKLGVLLPCNVIVQDLGNGLTEVAAMDPVSTMSVVENESLKVFAERIRESLVRAIEAL